MFKENDINILANCLGVCVCKCVYVRVRTHVFNKSPIFKSLVLVVQVVHIICFDIGFFLKMVALLVNMTI